MGASRIIGAALILVVFTLVFTYILSYPLVLNLLNYKYPYSGELPLIAALLDESLLIFDNLTLLAILSVMSFLLGVLIRDKSGVAIGITATILIVALELFIVSKYLPEVWNNLVSTMSVLDYFKNGAIYGLLTSCFSGFGGWIFSPRRDREYLQNIGEPITILSKCPKCNAEFKSNPLYCSKCGSLLRENNLVISRNQHNELENI
ncbi:MAG: hypothetical protein ACTSSJ_06950 [Candidatus Odinarchaeia archaeon]